MLILLNFYFLDFYLLRKTNKYFREVNVFPRQSLQVWSSLALFEVHCSIQALTVSCHTIEFW